MTKENTSWKYEKICSLIDSCRKSKWIFQSARNNFEPHWDIFFWGHKSLMQILPNMVTGMESISSSKPLQKDKKVHLTRFHQGPLQKMQVWLLWSPMFLLWSMGVKSRGFRGFEHDKSMVKVGPFAKNIHLMCHLKMLLFPMILVCHNLKNWYSPCWSPPFSKDASIVSTKKTSFTSFIMATMGPSPRRLERRWLPVKLKVAQHQT